MHTKTNSLKSLARLLLATIVLLVAAGLYRPSGPALTQRHELAVAMVSRYIINPMPGFDR